MLLFAVQLQPNEPEPQFLQPLENMTASQGRDVQFTCIVDHLGPYRVRRRKLSALDAHKSLERYFSNCNESPLLTFLAAVAKISVFTAKCFRIGSNRLIFSCP